MIEKNKKIDCFLKNAHVHLCRRCSVRTLAVGTVYAKSSLQRNEAKRVGIGAVLEWVTE
jgi:hypothetical protein